MNHFPEGKRKFGLKSIYNGSRDGWEIGKFRDLVFNKGPTLIIFKVDNGRICGGYTSKNWDANGNRKFGDPDAFVFSVDLNTKYLPTNASSYAIHPDPKGICFGNCILLVRSSNKLNDANIGYCRVGTDRRYNIAADGNGKSPLTSIDPESRFTVAELEVFSVSY